MKGIEILERTPATLRALLAGLGEEWLHRGEGGESWSPYEVVGHLIHGERTDWMQRVRSIVEHGTERTFEPFDREAQLAAGRDAGVGELLDEFERLRAANLEALRGLALGPADMERRGVHPDFGEVTLSELLASWVVHDLGHLAQIARTLAAQLADDVGPWVEYLPIVGERRRYPPPAPAEAPEIEIRAESMDRFSEVERLHERAFGRAAEAELLRRVRPAAAPELSLIALEDQQVVGHVLFTPVTIEGASSSLTAVGLGPMAVLPERQRLGIGSQLVHRGLDACREAGYALVVVLGHPDYYPRFGFRPAADLGIRYPGEAPGEAFMALELDAEARPTQGGVARYHEAFSEV